MIEPESLNDTCKDSAEKLEAANQISPLKITEKPISPTGCGNKYFWAQKSAKVEKLRFRLLKYIFDIQFYFIILFMNIFNKFIEYIIFKEFKKIYYNFIYLNFLKYYNKK